MGATNHAAKKQVAHAQPAQQVVSQPAPEIPQPPPTPEEMPATPPKVSMSAGQLSIIAENSTLGDVLNAVKKVTGAAVDAPNSATNERIVVSLGPGQPQEVLHQLLAGSKFDYIILGSPTNAAAIDKIILTPRSGAGGANGPMTAGASQPGPPRGYQPPEMPDQGDNDEEAAQPEPTPQPEETQQPPAAGAQQPEPGQNGQPTADQNQQQGPKSPEQLLQELQRMQQQQRPQRGPAPQ